MGFCLKALFSRTTKKCCKNCKCKQNNDCKCKYEACECNTSEQIFAPATGKLIKLSRVKDGVFSKEMLGKGFAVQVGNTGKKDIFAPISGKVNMVFPTKHALGFASLDNKTQILLHLGIDTVELEGKGIEIFVKLNQKIQAGDKIATVNLDYLIKSGITNTDIIVIVLNESEYNNFKFLTSPQREIDTIPFLVGINKKS
ncbi:PTS sugar transporter subunit IIA [Mesomycoplasma hyopneumoniae]|uniref:PTS sugar transporter subunit IIA n=1 Tax=Mesomycoplasma hyopneumoniae TaxID=2099 RepID=UPI0015C6246F|nr:PTS glucose transporter subunit IIA [Mesomycoplasma hyopneumoniae]QLG43683.1 PTS glucose transporter subunit IIA [Mesomycoplasma hyopneumoniae]